MARPYFISFLSFVLLSSYRHVRLSRGRVAENVTVTLNYAFAGSRTPNGPNAAAYLILCTNIYIVASVFAQRSCTNTWSVRRSHARPALNFISIYSAHLGQESSVSTSCLQVSQVDYSCIYLLVSNTFLSPALKPGLSPFAAQEPVDAPAGL